MAKTKDFFGKDITEVIEQACKFYDTTQDQLNFEVLETGSAGIFGLCRKQAHIRASIKEGSSTEEELQPTPTRKKESKRDDSNTDESLAEAVDTSKEDIQAAQDVEPEQEDADIPSGSSETTREQQHKPDETDNDVLVDKDQEEQVEVVEPPPQESLDAIATAIDDLLRHMNYPSQVTVTAESTTVYCNISSEHEEHIIGPEGRTLDSLQYLLRKMLLQSLPEKFMLSLDVGNFRERRAEDLKERAKVLAAQVKEDGKTQAIPALNPSERRIVHMVLQEDKGIRSRSVGDGLFKKVLIYKPGKGRRSGPKKRKA